MPDLSYIDDLQGENLPDELDRFIQEHISPYVVKGDGLVIKAQLNSLFLKQAEKIMNQTHVPGVPSHQLKVYQNKLYQAFQAKYGGSDVRLR